MTTQNSNIDSNYVDRLVRHLVDETPAGERVRANLGTSVLRNIVIDVLALTSQSEFLPRLFNIAVCAEDVLKLWKSPVGCVTGQDDPKFGAPMTHLNHELTNLYRQAGINTVVDLKDRVSGVEALRGIRRTLETLLTCDHCAACEYCNGHKLIRLEIASIDAALTLAASETK